MDAAATDLPDVDSGAVEQVRRFHRIVTQRVGALDDRYLARDRPLGQARLLWEIGAGADGGVAIRDLRARLDLDSGYLSRLLRALEADDLVAVGPSEADRRVRVARLTDRGRTERAVLDERSDALARSLVEPLRPDQRRRLVTAMGEVERLITAALVAVAPVDPEDPAAQRCLQRYAAELATRFEDGFDTGRSRPVDPAGMRPPEGTFLLARVHGEAVGCVALRLRPGPEAEVKRMWVDPAARGLGVARRLLDAVEAPARAAGAPALRLDTNRTLVEAIALYRSAGFVEVPAFNDEPYAHHWFEKRLEH
ncbi:MAG TPA: bifunctional helix-turn-helix transcriptional regulator/GNAT family N-acetyltransferase [Iamia sp.]|nr:bifunctional helix-turn-helix transcriptional regulator/GNAT family N-acetyltransferase [Iamia sp.]